MSTFTDAKAQAILAAAAALREARNAYRFYADAEVDSLAGMKRVQLYRELQEARIALRELVEGP